jgi:hypothetical protein
MKTKTLTRRQFLIGAATLMGSAALHPLHRVFEIPPGQFPDDPSNLYLPFVTRTPDHPPLGKVIHVRSTGATHWQGEKDFWNHVDQNVVNTMVEQGLKALTGYDTLAEAWRALIPSYRSGQKIAIKVNFNNTSTCTDIDGVIDGIIEPVNALVVGLEQIGVARSDICVYDAIRALPARFTSRALSGISFYDGSYQGNCQNSAGFSYQFDAYIPFNPPPGVSMPSEVVTDVLRNATLINIPIMKGGHPIARVTLGFKNHFGTIDNPGGLHTYINVVQKPPGYRTDYNPLVDIYRSQHIGLKTVLTVGDGLFAAIDFAGAPQTWSTFGNQLPNSLFFSIDPVAIDCVMHDFIAAQPGTNIPSGANNYLILAANAGLGVFETINPWSGSYSFIDYRSVNI